ncbi:MAG: hypothetical protein AB9903_22010 [Vulcanimicrobiota bacterium]
MNIKATNISGLEIYAPAGNGYSYQTLSFSQKFDWEDFSGLLHTGLREKEPLESRLDKKIMEEKWEKVLDSPDERSEASIIEDFDDSVSIGGIRLEKRVYDSGDVWSDASRIDLVA